jgi:hypothetical protein
VQGAVDDDRLQFSQFLVTIALLTVAGLSIVTVSSAFGSIALLLVAEFSAAIFVVAAAIRLDVATSCY